MRGIRVLCQCPLSWINPHCCRLQACLPILERRLLAKLGDLAAWQALAQSTRALHELCRGAGADHAFQAIAQVTHVALPSLLAAALF